MFIDTSTPESVDVRLAPSVWDHQVALHREAMRLWNDKQDADGFEYYAAFDAFWKNVERSRRPKQTSPREAKVLILPYIMIVVGDAVYNEKTQ